MKPTTSLSSRCILSLLGCVALLGDTARAAGPDVELDFLERFALAEDRSSVVSELVPGTEDFYYFSALLAQHEGRLGDVAGLLEPWVKRHGETPRVKEIRYRQALLEYPGNRKKSVDYLVKEFGLRFLHERERLDAKPDFPTRLSPDLVSWNALLEKSLRPDRLDRISDAGLDRLIRDDVVLNAAQRRELLSRLKYPDYERLVGLVAADLRTPQSRGFGEFDIHRRLTTAQLLELAGLIPDLENNPAYVDARLVRLRPDADTSLDRDREARKAYLDRLQDYAGGLGPAFGSLKASVLFRRLVLARSSGEYPREEFLEYLKLPRRMGYMEPKYLSERSQRGVQVDVSVDYTAITGFPPIGNDEALVRDYLEHYFREDEGYQRYAPYIRESWLKQVFAETKLLHGIGDPEQWYSLLQPGRVQELRERVELGFPHENREQFAVAEEVALALDVKNVEELLVKVYEINALNYHRDEKREINTDLNLDGLVANEEKTWRYDEAPIRRHRETFTFESMRGKRGTWVVEFIGNGISSRALVRKGKLQYLSSTTPGGELVRVLDESNTPVEEPAIWFGGKRYEADENGLVLLPFSTSGSVPVVLADGDFSSFARVDLPQETYRLEAGILLDQETLLPGREASVVIRPRLSLGGEPVTLSLLEEVELTVQTTDHDGVESASRSENFELFDEKDSVHTFRVPSRLGSVKVTLSGKIDLVSQSGEEQEFSVERSFAVNGIDRDRRTRDVHLSRLGDRYVLEVLGKSGEPVPDASVTVRVWHPDFEGQFPFSLKTDASGRIDLGALAGIRGVAAQGEGIGEQDWFLAGDRVTRGDTMHAASGTPVVIPFPDAGEALDRSEVAVFAMRGEHFESDVFDKASLENGALVLTGLDPGDYRVVLRDRIEVIQLRVTDSNRAALGYSLGENRHLELSNARPLHIATIEEAGEGVRISLANAGDLTRVHVLATRFLPTFDPFDYLGSGSLPPLVEVTRGTNDSLYVSGRDIGEEYRYILERRSAKRFPGNLLPRPGLILNPWALNETETEIDDAEAGESYEKGRDMLEAKRKSVPGAMRPEIPTDSSTAYSPSYLFLADPGLFLPNVEIAEDGIVTIARDALGDRQHLHVLAVDGTSTAYGQFALAEPEGGAELRDLRLRETLDLEKTFTQQRNVTLLKKGEVLTIDDLRAAELETYATVGEVYATLAAIRPDPTLQDFAFVANWPELDDAAKRERYSEHACHELHFFLSKKDPEFFREVVRPYLRHKKDKTFLDHYLLEDPLERYLAPWEFGRLNIVERILLGRRIGEGERQRTAAHVASLQDLVPPDPNRSAELFRQALRGRRSSGGGGHAGFGFAGAGGGAMVADAFADTGNRRQLGLVSRGARAASVDPFAAPAPAAEAAPAEPQAAADKAEAEEMAPADPFAAPVQAGAGLAARGNAKALRERAKQQALYRKLESTKEWAENNYHHLPIARQVADLVTANDFWEDFAEWDGEGGFYSRDFPAASRNFTEMMFALSVLDLPFASEDPEIDVEENTLRFTANSPVVIFHEEIEEAERSEEETPILVSQNFYRVDDRYRYVDGQKLDKFVTEEFLTGVTYGSQVVATNPTSSAHPLDLLVQIPAGAIPVAASDYTKSYPIILQPFSTQRVEVEFYFPKVSGEEPFRVYPVQVARDERVIASGEAAEFRVVDRLTRHDEASWEYLSQHGSEREVLDYLAENNLHRIQLSRIAWRVRENVDFFRQVTRLIAERHAYDATLWSYGFHHDDTGVIREFLKHREDFLRQCGMAIECELVSLDPVGRHWHQHLEYAPLVNARAHRLGRDLEILNDRFRTQYRSFLELASYRPKLGNEDRLAVAAYFFLQDRIEEALAWHESVEPDQLEARLQYDYLTAYAELYRERPEESARIAAAYLEHPVERWRERFARVDEQVKALGGGEVAPDGEEDERDRQMERLSATDPFLELTAEGREVKLLHRNIDGVTVNYYEMDLEFLFSSQPFVSGTGGQFRYVRPNRSEAKELPEGDDTFRFAIPEEFASKNVLVEVTGAGRTEAVAVYSNQLEVEISDRYGRLEVRDDGDDAPVPKTYVKVFARMKDGSVKFFKDGYTDLRGRFDYVSLNTNELDQVDELSLLVMSEEKGSLVREVKPPQR